LHAPKPTELNHSRPQRISFRHPASPPSRVLTNSKTGTNLTTTPILQTWPQPTRNGGTSSLAVFKSRLKTFLFPKLSLLFLLTDTLSAPSASEVTTLRRYTNLFIIIIIKVRRVINPLHTFCARTVSFGQPQPSKTVSVQNSAESS